MPRARELPSHTVSHLVWQEGEVLPSVTFKTRVRTDEEGDNPFDWKGQHVESALVSSWERRTGHTALATPRLLNLCELPLSLALTLTLTLTTGRT